MRGWREHGGWPLAVACLSLTAGVVFGVSTVKVEQAPPPEPSPGPTITTDEFVAEIAAALAEELGRPLTPRQTRHVQERVVDVVGDEGTLVVVAPDGGSPAPSPSSTTTTTTTTTTQPPRPPTTRPTFGDVIDGIVDDYVPPTTLP